MKICLFLILFLNICVASANELLDRYVYTSQFIDITYSESGNIDEFNPIIDELYVDTKLRKVGGKSWSTDYFTCGELENIFCFMSAGLNLSIPKAAGEWPVSWHDRFAEYHYLGTRSINLFGKKYKVELIYRNELVNDDAPYYTNTHDIYLYSKKDGLISYSIYDNDDKIVQNFYSAKNQGIRIDLIEEQFTQPDRQ